jgi:hypothetical protein
VEGPSAPLLTYPSYTNKDPGNYDLFSKKKKSLSGWLLPGGRGFKGVGFPLVDRKFLL